MRLFVPLRPDEFDRLLRVATAERRRPQEQAALLIARSLAGLGIAPECSGPPPDHAPKTSDPEQPHGPG